MTVDFSLPPGLVKSDGPPIFVSAPAAEGVQHYAAPTSVPLERRPSSHSSIGFSNLHVTSPHSPSTSGPPSPAAGNFQTSIDPRSVHSAPGTPAFGTPTLHPSQFQAAVATPLPPSPMQGLGMSFGYVDEAMAASN